MTTIQSNGSKWAGEQPDSIEELIEVLKSKQGSKRRVQRSNAARV